MKYLCLICAEPQYMMEYRTAADAAEHFEEYGALPATSGPAVISWPPTG